MAVRSVEPNGGARFVVNGNLRREYSEEIGKLCDTRMKNTNVEDRSSLQAGRERC